MRMPGPKLRFQSDLERRFLNAFVQLKKMRMALTDANPNNFHVAFGWKSSDSFDWQKKGPELNRVEFFAQGKIDILRNVREKTEGQMDLITRRPTNSVNARIEID